MTAVVWPATRLGLVLTAVLAVPALGIAAAARGGAGAVGAGLGLVVVALFFAISKMVVWLVGRRSPHLLLPAALGTYVVKIALLGVLLVALDDVSAIDSIALAWSVFAGVFAWIGTELWVATHTRVPFYDPEAFRERNRSGHDTLPR